jgi:hypothetical protein
LRHFRGLFRADKVQIRFDHRILFIHGKWGSVFSEYAQKVRFIRPQQNLGHSKEKLSARQRECSAITQRKQTMKGPGGQDLERTERSDSEAIANKGFRPHNIQGASWADDHRFFPSEDNDAFFEYRKLETKGSIRFHQDTTSDNSSLAKDQPLAWEQFENPSPKTPYGAAYVNVLK